MNSKNKGKRGELEFSKFCREHGFAEVRRGQQYNGLEGEDVVGLPGVHVEVKRVEHLNIHKAMDQSIADGIEGSLSIVAHRKNNTSWLVTMPAEEFLKLIQK